MYIFQKNDFKYRAWSQALAEQGIETLAVEGSPIKAPLLILWMIIKRKCINGYVFRYLNDSPSFLKTIMRLFSEVATVLLIKAVGGRVLWIAHNVNKESFCYHKKLSQIRRLIIKNASQVIIVTDPLLQVFAKKMISDAHAITWICFGAPSEEQINSETLKVKDAICRLRHELEERNPGRKVYIGLCVSSPSPKCVHYLSVAGFVDKYNTDDVAVGVVVVGAISAIDDNRFHIARNKILNNKNIVLIDESIPVKEKYLKNDIDFFYRSLDDLSVSYSLYVSASVRKPIISEEGTFLAEMISKYNLGGVAPLIPDSENGNWLQCCIEDWQPEKADIFLSEKNWRVAAEQFKFAMNLKK